MNTYTVERVDGGFKVRVTGPGGGPGHLMDEIFSTEPEAETFAANQQKLETGRVGMSPEDRPL
jgi:hypothetical protein